jgi:PAS domain S-box-containing protein
MLTKIFCLLIRSLMAPELLIIDDDVRLLRALVELLQVSSIDATVRTASSAESALALITEHDYDAIVSDIRMPHMDGFSLMEKIHERWLDIPILLMTGQGDHDLGVRALNAGAYAFIPKPIDTDIFLAWLTRAIQVRRLSRDVQEKTGRLERQTEVLEQAVQERTAHLQTALGALKTAEHGNRHLAALVESSEDAIISKSLTGLIQTWNRGAERLYGYMAGDVIGRHISLLIPADRQIEEADILARILRGERIPPFETVRVRKDGSSVHISLSVSPIVDEGGHVIGASKIARDITERKRIEQTLHELRRHNELILESAGDGIYGIDSRGRSTFVNPAAARLLGWTPNELRGASMHRILHHSHPDGTPYPAEECPIYAALQDGHVHALDSEVFWKRDGTSIPVDYVSTPIWDEGRIQGAVVVFKDITERKGTEQHIRRLLGEAEARERQLVEKQAQLVQAAKLASIGELTTGIAHEINNPLNNIALFVGNAIDRLESRRTHGAIVSNLKKAEVQVRRAETIINHLRAFGRLSSPHREPVSINKVIQSAVSFVSEALRGRNISTQLDLSPAQPIVDGNEVQLEQVFVNLLTNARDALESADRKTISITSRTSGTLIEVVFIDTGAGIPADLLPRIFDPFFTTKPSGQGTGLGLSISYGILKEHHGDIEVESRIGEGTTFLIRLPIGAKSDCSTAS